MRNFVQTGDTLTIPAPVNAKSGDFVQSGAIFGVAAEDATAGADLDVVTRGVFTLPKAAGAIGIGDTVYWDATAKNVTTTATDNLKVGVATAAVASNGTTVAVRLSGAF